MGHLPTTRVASTPCWPASPSSCHRSPDLWDRPPGWRGRQTRNSLTRKAKRVLLGCSDVGR